MSERLESGESGCWGSEDGSEETGSCRAHGAAQQAQHLLEGVRDTAGGRGRKGPEGWYSKSLRMRRTAENSADHVLQRRCSDPDESSGPAHGPERTRSADQSLSSHR